MTGKQTVIVTLSDEAVARMDDTVRALRRSGLEVTQKLEILGQVTGVCSSTARGALRAVPGVVSVEESGTVSVPPPESDVQ